ncbi:two-component system regulatory protein YycI [Alkalihalobacillus macyae]|uniref:two-component system regulatory protein YycI n=1 Tax=Guptibacillus hwajinpoensis TaxID=208199 RepID=UPI00273CEE36|nr:two-component system regulatory protein YycI [Alkalihalobacillus macyae]MDP4553004.1 two-component system regulatory protein YycI [Alkalihalobacillus macyae]
MDWNRTKTILILTFLVFNIFLASDLYKKQTDISGLEQQNQLTLDEQLKDLNVTYDNDPSLQSKKMAFISGNVHYFTDKEEKTLEENTSQDITLNGRKLISTLKKPFPISDPDAPSAYSIFLETYVYEGGKYQYYRKDSNDPNIVYFTETHEDKPLYSQDSGMVIVTLEDDKVVSYTQTYLNLEKIVKERKIDPISETIGLLVSQQDIRAYDKVEDVSIGYYTVTSEDERDTFVFVPTWRVVVENKKDDPPGLRYYYVNAIEKTVFSDSEENADNDTEEEEESNDKTVDPDSSTPQSSTGD